MKTTILRAFLVIVMVGVLFGAPAPLPVQAGGSGHWTNVPPALDGAAPASEWGSAMLISLTNFKMRYENDEQFIYFLIDVTAESPASPPPISTNENFHIYIDTDADGSSDLLYFLNNTSPYPLY